MNAPLSLQSDPDPVTPLAASTVLRMNKLKGRFRVLKAACHNLREIQAELGAFSHIDSSRTPKNELLYGPTTGIAVHQLAQALMSVARVKLRKDQVFGLEILFSLPAGHQATNGCFFSDCLEWTALRYGRENILSAVVHHDENAPHMHVLILPLVNGRMNGSKLMGHALTLRRTHQDFHADVGRHHGLRPPSKPLTAKDRLLAAEMIKQSLAHRGDPILGSILLPQVLAWIQRAPEQFLSLLGLEIPTRSRVLRTMAEIFTSPGKGPRRGNA